MRKENDPRVRYRTLGIGALDGCSGPRLADDGGGGRVGSSAASLFRDSGAEASPVTSFKWTERSRKLAGFFDLARLSAPFAPKRTSFIPRSRMR